ncbi:peptide-methionine (S)-S-oxide reductase MsrA [Altibacter sp. HG106]|uniref:peptide-methionine (S)-S-oxide reductase MsrA n=1 Tax=Altibacter sp. HG106 TaxID=3023937 RepID=UPI0023502464|nr:peptide-methionine (S)-S-oxide reductase MsrA [Altibacter sp. HG106]MDC7993650.1 peptide-methionine (S)-S-oxide reductase MsrA [Altibacter sp. HG106]
MEQIVLASGCFWCTEAVFQRVEGVVAVVSGFTGGHIKNPAYREICTGRTGHAEGVQITYDPAKVSLQKLLEIFFATHDPTTLNRQGNDVGTQYRSGIFYTSESQKETAVQFIALLEEKRIFEAPIVTEITPLDVFYTAEEDHQDFYNQHTQQPYCQYIIDPKLKTLSEHFTEQLKKTNP